MKMNGITRRSLTLACATLLLIQLGGCVVAFGDNGQSKPDTYTKGQWIKKQATKDNQKRALATRIATALEDDPLLSQADIDFHVTGGVVTLTGTVYDMATYQHAVKVVQNVKGVKTVTSRIELNITE